MISGSFTLPTEEMAGRLVVDGQNWDVLQLGSWRGANNQHVTNCYTGHKMLIHLKCITPTLKTL
jgi:hypothetical protein